MAEKYGFFHMLSDVLFNGNKVSGSRNEDDDDRECRSGGSYSCSSSSSSSSREFDPSDAAGDAFRSVFGDDN